VRRSLPAANSRYFPLLFSDLRSTKAPLTVRHRLSISKRHLSLALVERRPYIYMYVHVCAVNYICESCLTSNDCWNGRWTHNSPLLGPWRWCGAPISV